MAAQVRYPALQADLLRYVHAFQFQVSQTPPAVPGTTWSSAARDGPPPSVQLDNTYNPFLRPTLCAVPPQGEQGQSPLQFRSCTGPEIASTAPIFRSAARSR